MQCDACSVFVTSVVYLDTKRECTLYMFSVFYSECSLLQSTCTTTKWLIVVVLLFQCTSCREENVNFDDFKEIPHIVIAIFIEKPIPFLEEFFARTAGLDYPKDKIDLFIHNAEEYHMNDVEDFIGRFNNSGDLKCPDFEWSIFIQILNGSLA